MENKNSIERSRKHIKSKEKEFDGIRQIISGRQTEKMSHEKGHFHSFAPRRHFTDRGDRIIGKSRQEVLRNGYKFIGSKDFLRAELQPDDIVVYQDRKGV